jgi:3-oxoacyl-(acyl-carrier-protein) synthase
MNLAITGLGVVSPVGTGKEAFFDALLANDTARAFAETPTVVTPAAAVGLRVAEVWGFDPSTHLGAKGHRSFDRLTKLLVVAGKLALEDAGVKADGKFASYAPNEVGVCSATAYGSLEEITELNRVAELEDPRYINPNRFPNTVINSAAGYVSIWEELRGPNTTLANGNVGALDGIVHAATHIAEGRSRAFVVGGGEALSDTLLTAVRLLGPSPGFAVAEGAVFVVVEHADSARARDARVLARVLGYGSAFVPPEREAQLYHLSPSAVAFAIGDALAEAGLEKDAIDGVVLGTSGLPAFDDAEREGVLEALGHMPETLTPKAIVGETFGGSGGFAMATSIAWLSGVQLTKRAAPPKHVIALAVGYHGNATAVVLGGADAR